jgi:tetratricopeptide (TPR) repeat protein
MQRLLIVTALIWSALVIPATAGAQALASDTTRREAMSHYRAGQELLTAERWDRAAEAFQAAIKLDPLFVDAHYSLGQAYMGAQRFSSAVQAYTRCLDAARSLHGLRDRDRVAVDRQIDEEIRELQDTVRRIQSQPGQGASALKAVQIETHIQDLLRNRSSNSGPFEPPAGVLLALGSAHFRNGEREPAEVQWAEAVRVNPKLGEAWNNLAVIYLQSARKPMAEDAVKRAERAGFHVNPRLKDDIKRMPAP